MSEPKPVIVPLTREHIIEMVGEEEGTKPTFKGIAGLVDGKLVAVAGLRYLPGHVLVFCHLKEEARQFKALIALAGAVLVRDAKRRHKRLIAMRDDDEPTSERWLRRLGFEPSDATVAANGTMRELWICRA